LTEGIGHKLAEAVQFTVACIGSYAFALYSSWQVGLTILSVAPFLVFATRFLVKMTTTQTKRANENYAYAGAIVSTTVSSMRTILSLNAVDKQIGLYRDATDYAAHQATQLSLWRGLATGLQMVTSLMAYIVLTGYGAYLLYRQVRSDGCDPSGTVEGVASCRPSGSNVFGALLGVQIGSNMLSQCAIAIEALTEAQVAAVPALKVLQRRVHENDVDEADYDDADKGYKKKDIESGGNGTTDGSSTSEHDGNSAGALTTSAAPILPKYVIDSSSHNGTKLKQVAGNIEFRNVSFSYPARPETQVVKSVSLMVPAGKTVAICGPSGSGKSTIVQLVERFYDPSAGSVLLDGNDLRTLNVKWLREQIGLVLQEPKLFGKSIGENIALGAPGASREDVEEAARLANAHDFIMTFPDGYDTMVGDLGGQLSGGQRQRIALARVLVKKPKILLLDEATSALDSESERIVQQALENLLEQSTFTTIVVAHRLSTIRNADLIAVMAQGVLHETGTHDELLAKKGLYYDLVQAQKTAPAAPAPPPPVPAAIESTPNADSQTADETSKEIAAANRRESTLDSSVFRVVHPGEQPLIEFRNIRFRYPARPDIDVFRDLNLSVYKGETLALVGPSGCGKSTVVQLIEAFYRPLDGAVLYCGVDTRELNTRWLRDEMGLVSQEAMLFATTIEENIRYGCPGATMEEIIAAAKQANCHNFITQFPDGYQTRIGEGSNLVSGGQKQRIAIARALVKKPKVLLLDEATSALDSESEKIVQAALDNLMADKGQTCVVIAHRLSTIRNADRIAVIDNGKVREIGSHDELMAKPNGKYRQLIQLQNLDDAEHHVQESESIEDDAPEETVDKKKSKETKEEKEDLSRDETKRLKKRAMMMGWQDKWYILVGIIGAIVAGIMYPSWGFMFGTSTLFASNRHIIYVFAF
jgi:ATP-binding cassette subfamily B (MDR/TAP) protein 1